MSTYTSEPGTRLAGRYRLVDQMVTGNGWTLWKAIDETLARPVSVLTFAAGFPRIPQVVTAARAASRLTDPRMAQVFDVEDGGGQAYIVLEWVGGDSLTDLLDAGGPLDPARACSLIFDASRAIAGAHALGQAHLRLTPDTLRWTRGSGIKITGAGHRRRAGRRRPDRRRRPRPVDRGHDRTRRAALRGADWLLARRGADPAARGPRLRRCGLHAAPGVR